jgi:guanylate kinase
VIVVSGPSGVGKTVVCEELVGGDSTLVRSVSATTRPPRSDERDGEAYRFWSEERFREEADRGRFLEWAEVHRHRYGTPREPIESHLRAGRCPVLNVDVQGGRSVKRILPDSVLVFVFPPSLEELEKRLRGRGTDSDEQVSHRLTIATQELAEWVHYDYAVVNDSLPATVAAIREILAAERARVPRLQNPPPDPGTRPAR